MARPSQHPSTPLPTFDDLVSRKPELWCRPSWAPGVLVADTPATGSEEPLHMLLMRMTACACPVCDPEGRQPFSCQQLLDQHLQSRHDKQQCSVCVSVGRK